MGVFMEQAKLYEQIAGDKGFWSDEPLEVPAVKLYKAAKICLIHSELSEALEGIREDKMDDHCPAFSSEVVELADAVIRILDYAYHYQLPLDEAIAAKSTFNAGRAYKHGKAF